MSRAATTSDSFNAVAEPRRRDILDFLAPAERPVGDIVVALGLAQPSVSKHLRVLLDVGLVEQLGGAGALRPALRPPGREERHHGPGLRRHAQSKRIGDL